MNGRLQDFRVYKGVAKYTSNFLVGSALPDILPDTPSGVATKTALTKINEGAVEFDRTNDYVSTSGAGFAFALRTQISLLNVMCLRSNQVGVPDDYIIDGRLVVKLQEWKHNGIWVCNSWIDWNLKYMVLEQQSMISVIIQEAKQWHHIVVTRSGSTNRMFIDGVLAAAQ